MNQWSTVSFSFILKQFFLCKFISKNLNIRISLGLGERVRSNIFYAKFWQSIHVLIFFCLRKGWLTCTKDLTTRENTSSLIVSKIMKLKHKTLHVSFKIQVINIMIYSLCVFIHFSRVKTCFRLLYLPTWDCKYMSILVSI